MTPSCIAVTRLRRACLACLVALLLWLPARVAGGNYRFSHLTSAQGLPHQQVEALAQDLKGYVWIGTRNGLVKYDGYETKVYYHDAANPHSLSHNYVHALLVDRRGRLWICTETGVCRYRPGADDFECYTQQPGLFLSIAQTSRGRVFFGGDMLCSYDETGEELVRHPLPARSHINYMAVDKADNLYLSTNNAIVSYDAAMTRLTTLNLAWYGDCVTSSNAIMPVFCDHRGRLWIGRNGMGVVCVDLRTGQQRNWSARDLSNGIVRTITEDASHRIWLGTEKGVTVISPGGGREILQHRFQDENGLSDNAVYAILCDRRQNVWIGSYFGGVDILLHDNGQFRHLAPGPAAENIKARVARMMVETRPGVFWIATEDGGINIYDQSANRFTVFSGIPELGTNVHSLYYDRRSGEMWIGTRFNGLFRYNMQTGSSKRYLRSHGLPSEAVFYIARQRSGRLWFATMQGLRYYDPGTDTFRPTGNAALDRTFVYTLCVDRADNLWAGTTNYGIFRLSAHGRGVENWRVGTKPGLKDNYIISLYEDSRGTLWIGSNNNGLQFVDHRGGQVKSPGGERLLSQCTVCSTVEDGLGHLWVSTSLGLFDYDLRTKAVVRYSVKNGLPVNQFNFSSSLVTQGGQLLFGSINGIVAFNPRTIRKEWGPFTVHLKELVINNQPVTALTPGSPLKTEIDYDKTITLSYDQARSFSIAYGVVMPASTDPVEYQVLLEGIDKDWRSVGDERRFNGYNLQPGTYVLHVRANNSNEGWDRCPVKTLTIIVRPPFYRSMWAWMLYLLLAVGLAWLAYHLFSVRLKERNAVKMANMEKEKVEEIDRMKSSFFTTVSHELKTPLSLIVAPLRSIARRELSTDSQKHLDTAIRNTRKMEELINELVTFNKIETANLPFYVQRGNAVEFVELAVEQFRDFAADKQITLTAECENNGEEVWFSPSYVERIVNNLLTNALKFTPRGGAVRVLASILTLPGDPSAYLQLVVSDTGIGIAKDELANIFERYYQTKRGYNVDNGGWGIGLSLVKRLVEIHHGTVSVESEVGQGTAFTVRLNVSADVFDAKCRITDDKALVAVSQYSFSHRDVRSTEASGTGGQGPQEKHPVSILIVDDNPDMLQFLADYFSSQYNVLTAADGAAALQITAGGQVELVVSDVMMPGMDGTELCRRLKQDVHTSHIPVILLTAKSEQADVLAGYESGAEAYVSKPFDPQILELQIKNILQLRASRQQEIANGHEGDIDAAQLSELDKKFLHQINALIDANIGNSDFSIAEMTAGMGISRTLLHTKMKNLMGISAGDYLRKRRMDRACKLLKEGYNVSETAYKTGFADPNYFSKVFRKQTGKSPTEFMGK